MSGPISYSAKATKLEPVRSVFIVLAAGTMLCVRYREREREGVEVWLPLQVVWEGEGGSVEREKKEGVKELEREGEGVVAD